eukprot:m.81807 g.81807  ORF g.81807 m.81807 type:complete len:68 (+) comp11032_c0_seq3:41-244(+)
MVSLRFSSIHSQDRSIPSTPSRTLSAETGSFAASLQELHKRTAQFHCAVAQLCGQERECVCSLQSSV